ncbi:MAG: hypothetical protein COZ06_11915 [Armatimonadetes bacterium CG_4_10_14_3_um_filter_66_18]|nr:MAG: hypothetical protein COZ06_11915 [Armatimonadetes bacterium CG_4_10_14_3_um_filter_66_18]
MRLAAVAAWYEQGKLSQEMAARVAGLDRTDFPLALARLGRDSFRVDLADLDKELGGPAGVTMAKRAIHGARLTAVLAALVVCQVAGEGAALGNAQLEVAVDSQTASWSVTDKRSGHTWRGSSAADRGTAAVQTGDGRRLARPLPELAGPGVTGTATFTLGPDAPELLVTLDGPPDATAKPFTFPDPLLATTPDAAWVIPQQEGLLLRVRNDPFPEVGFDSMISMPWLGVTDLKTGAGYLMILETPDDARFAKRVVTVDGEKLPVGVPEWLPQTGKFGYQRRLRYVFFDSGGYVAMCKRYREYARSQGTVRTLTEKAKDVPAVAKLAGAVDVWYTRSGESPVRLAELLKSLGVDRCLFHLSSVGDHPPREVVKAVEDLGYLAGHYDIYTDLHESGHPWDNWDRYKQYHFPEPVIRAWDGSLQKGWYTVHDQGKAHLSYVVCPLEGLRALRARVPVDQGAGGQDAWFIDCATSCGLYECYSADHPATRTQDRAVKLAQFEFLYKHGLVSGSEGGRDWALRYASYFEGLMSTACWNAAPRNLSNLSGPLTVDDKYMAFDHGPGRRVPLWELVHHDASQVTWWWGDAQLRVPENWWRKDLFQILYGTMPLWMLQGEGEALFLENPEAFRDSYARVSPVTRAVFGVEMTDHVFLTGDCCVQRTVWANGLTVTANFGATPALEMPGCSYRLDGDATRFPGLSLGKPIVMPYQWEPTKSAGLLNADFHAGTLGWTGTKGIALTAVDNARGGKRAARFCGTNEDEWLIGGSASRLPLAPGKRYRFGAWVKLTALDPKERPPWVAVTVTGEDGWITNIHTPRYDPGRLGEWQRLETSFECPADATAGAFNIEKFSRESVTVELLLLEPSFEGE